MDHLTTDDYRTLLDAVYRLHEASAPETLARTMLEVVHGLVPCEHSSYSEVDMVGRRTKGLCSLDQVDRSWKAFEPAAAEHFDDHPVLHFFKDHPDAGTRRISDFCEPAAFHETGLYRDCYRHLGIDHQMVVRLPGDAGLEVGLAANRSGRDFDERDRACFDVLRPHLQQAVVQCATAHRVREDARRYELAARAVPCGLIVLDRRDRPTFLNEQARDQLKRYFADPSVEGGRLPRAVAAWVQTLSEGLQLARPAENPWTVPGPGGELRIAATRRHTPGVWVLCLEERTVGDQLDALSNLGLTRRQAEVLLWVAQGKTNPEIAIILGVSARTVQKHLEHVFETLGVETRTAATLAAIEAMHGLN